MKYTFVDESWEDYLYWQKTNKKILKRIKGVVTINLMKKILSTRKPPNIKFIENLPKFRIKGKLAKVQRFGEKL